jgi:naphtho-gamma-pyrone polyketide synthase
LRSDDPREMKWLLNDRSDFSGNGWEGLVGRGKVVVETMAGANHFTMMAGRKVHELADFMVRAMN